MLQALEKRWSMCEREIKMAASVYYWYYCSPEGQTFAGVRVWKESIVLLVSIDFSIYLSYTHVLSIGLTMFGIIAK